MKKVYTFPGGTLAIPLFSENARRFLHMVKFGRAKLLRDVSKLFCHLIMTREEETVSVSTHTCIWPWLNISVLVCG